MRCGFPKEPILNCEPAAFREAVNSHHIDADYSSLMLVLVAIRAPALAQSPFERRLRAEGGPPQYCIIFDTRSKQDLGR
jgi:hypothetical protein